MRRGLTLIELIFTMVIVAVVFTVVAKLIQSFAQTGEVAIKEDALFNAISQMALVTSYPWDGGGEANASYIRATSNGASRFDCNSTSGYRQGGFVGGRSCGEEINASSISGVGSPPFGSIGDFDGNSVTTFIEECAPELYEMNATVTYVRDDNLSDDSVVGTSNSKRIGVKVYYDSGYSKGATGGIRCITQLETHSYNIGLAKINSRIW